MKPRAHRFAPKCMLAALVVAIAFTACDLKVVEEDVLLRYDQDTDSLDALLIYQGVVANSDDPKKIGKSIKVVQRLLAGRREFMILDWPLYWDLDEMAEDLADEEDEAAQRLRAIVDGIRLTDVGMFYDSGGRLCGYQRLHVPGVQRILALWNRQFREYILEASEDDELKEDTPLLDDTSRTWWIEHARTRFQWFRFDAEGLHVELPMTRQSAQRFVLNGIEDLRKAEEDEVSMLANLLLSARSVKIDADRVKLTFGHRDPKTGVLHFSLHRDDFEYRSTLKETLSGMGLGPRKGVTLESLKRFSPLPDPATSSR